MGDYAFSAEAAASLSARLMYWSRPETPSFREIERSWFATVRAERRRISLTREFEKPSMTCRSTSYSVWLTRERSTGSGRSIRTRMLPSLSARCSNCKAVRVAMSRRVAASSTSATGAKRGERSGGPGRPRPDGDKKAAPAPKTTVKKPKKLSGGDEGEKKE